MNGIFFFLKILENVRNLIKAWNQWFKKRENIEKELSLTPRYYSTVNVISLVLGAHAKFIHGEFPLFKESSVPHRCRFVKGRDCLCFENKLFALRDK